MEKQEKARCEIDIFGPRECDGIDVSDVGKGTGPTRRALKQKSETNESKTPKNARRSYEQVYTNGR